MKTIRISQEVWDAMSARGKFGETPDTVLRRILEIGSKIVPDKKTGKMKFNYELLAKGLKPREIVPLYLEKFPDVTEKTAKNSVSFCASMFKKRSGHCLDELGIQRKS